MGNVLTNEAAKNSGQEQMDPLQPSSGRQQQMATKHQDTNQPTFKPAQNLPHSTRLLSQYYQLSSNWSVQEHRSALQDSLHL